MVESLHAIELQAAAALVVEVDRARESLRASIGHQVSSTREGLARGSQVESCAAAATALATTRQHAHLVALQLQRAREHVRAAQAHRASSLELRQVEQILDKQILLRAQADARREQSLADERYLSQKSWTEREEPDAFLMSAH